MEKRQYFTPELYLKDQEKLKYQTHLREFTRVKVGESEGEGAEDQAEE